MKANVEAQLRVHIKAGREKVQKYPHQHLHHHELGTLLGAANELSEAIACFDRAIALCPTYGEAWFSRAAALQLLGRFAEAYESAIAACRLIPAFAPGIAKVTELGLVTGQSTEAEFWPDYRRRRFFIKRMMKRTLGHSAGATDRVLTDTAPKSETELRAGLARKPDDPMLLAGLGLMLSNDERYLEAEYMHRYALSIAPGFGAAAMALARLLQDRRRDEEAQIVIEDAIKAGSRDPAVTISLYRHRYAQCDWRDHERVVKNAIEAIRLSPGSCEPFLALNVCEDHADLLRVASAFGARAAKGVVPVNRPPRTRRDKLTLGYISADFRKHAVALHVSELLELHDKNRFELIGYATTPDDEVGMYRRRIRASCDKFREVPDNSNRQIAEMIVADGVDILIDLTGFTMYGRPALFAHRAAPVQVNMIGFPGTLGPGLADYFLTDHIQARPEDEKYFAECLVRLPTLQLPDRKRPRPLKTKSRADHRLPDTGFVFACKNTSAKLTPEMFAVWMRILRAVEGSILWLVATNPVVERNLQNWAEQLGVSRERLYFAPRVDYAEYLERYHHIDLVLDTLPYNSHSVSVDVIWMGCAFLTCFGPTHVGRVGATVLHAAGMSEMIAKDIDEYERIAIEIAKSPERLAAIRKKCDAARSNSALFDLPPVVRGIEQAFQIMAERSAKGLAPQSFDVPRER